MAVWQNNKKYPAQITKILDNGIYLVKTCLLRII